MGKFSLCEYARRENVIISWQDVLFFSPKKYHDGRSRRAAHRVPASAPPAAPETATAPPRDRPGRRPRVGPIRAFDGGQEIALRRPRRPDNRNRPAIRPAAGPQMRQQRRRLRGGPARARAGPAWSAVAIEPGCALLTFEAIKRSGCFSETTETRPVAMNRRIRAAFVTDRTFCPNRHGPGHHAGRTCSARGGACAGGEWRARCEGIREMASADHELPVRMCSPTMFWMKCPPNCSHKDLQPRARQTVVLELASISTSITSITFLQSGCSCLLDQRRRDD